VGSSRVISRARGSWVSTWRSGRIGIWKCWFGGRKTGVPGEKPSEQGREPATNSTHIWHRDRESNPAHIGGRRVLSPVRRPCSSGLVKVFPSVLGFVCYLKWKFSLSLPDVHSAVSVCSFYLWRFLWAVYSYPLFSNISWGELAAVPVETPDTSYRGLYSEVLCTRKKCIFCPCSKQEYREICWIATLPKNGQLSVYFF